jgi:hypothetical protein
LSNQASDLTEKSTRNRATGNDLKVAMVRAMESALNIVTINSDAPVITPGVEAMKSVSDTVTVTISTSTTTGQDQRIQID